MHKKEHQGEYAVVTGASRGIGFELAKCFARDGHDLLIVADSEAIFAAANTLADFGVEVTPVQLDLATEVGSESLYEKLKQLGRPVDALALNAGVGSGGEFINTDLEKEVDLINLNVLSVVRLTKRILRDMVARGHGRILFTSSIAAETPGPYEAVYAASKAFVQSFAMALRFEVKDKGVTITSLQPGVTDTNFFARADMLDTPAGRGKKDDPADVARQGYEALMSGRSDVVAGSVINKLNVAGTKLMSEKQGAKMQAKSTKPNSIH